MTRRLRNVCVRPSVAKCADSQNVTPTTTTANSPSPTDKPVQPYDEEGDKAPYKMIQTIGLSVGAAVAYIIIVLGLMFYCKKRRHAKRLQKGQDGEEPEMECLNGGFHGQEECFCRRLLSQLARDRRTHDGNLLPPCG